MIVCFTGGGTLGHVYPALAVHEQLKHDPAYRPCWIGRNDRFEKKAVQDSGIEFHAIRSGKLRRYHSLRNILDIGNICIGFFQALWILSRIRPQILFSKGGFVSVPPVLAAFMLRIPVISHESDASPGLATRINTHFSQVVCVPFCGRFGNIPAEKLVVSGNPVRSVLVEKARTPDTSESVSFLDPDERLVVVLGGSSGAVQLNTLVQESLSVLTGHAYIYHQCGYGNAEDTVAPRYTRVAFIHDHLLASLLKRADLVVSRAGAGTLAELALFGCPSLLIPLSNASSRGDQIENARRLAQMDAARVLSGDVSAEQFGSEVLRLLDDRKGRSLLSANLHALSNEHSAEDLALLIRSHIRKE